VGVVAQGRALLTEDGGECWMMGVNPGSVAASGAQRGDAFCAFKEGYLSVLYDIANEAETFEAFEQEVKEFFAATNEPNERDWQQALREVRAGRLNTDLPKIDADETPPQLLVIEIDEPTPQANALDNHFAEAA
jgi:hypothetical protein